MFSGSFRPATTIILAVCLWLGSRPAAAENYAFLVGVSNYDETQLDPLAYARDDVLAFRELLLEAGFAPDNVVTLHDDLRTLEAVRYLAEADKIRRQFTQLLQTLQVEDSLIVALAGHGVEFKNENEPYFCPLDVDLDDPTRTSLVSLAELYRELENCSAQRKLLLVDACRIDPQSRLARANRRELQSVTLPQLVKPPEGVVALFSCAAGQRAFEHPELRHGIFFYHVLQAFRGEADDGDRQLTIDELLNFAKSRTARYARVELDVLQTPRQRGFFEGEWILREIDPTSTPAGDSPLHAALAELVTRARDDAERIGDAEVKMAALLDVARLQDRVADPAARQTLANALNNLNELPEERRVFWQAAVLAQQGDLGEIETLVAGHDPALIQDFARLFVVQELAAMGRLEPARLTLGRIEDQTFRNEALSAVISALIQAGRYDEARDELDQIRDSMHADRHTFELITAMVDGGHTTEAWELHRNLMLMNYPESQYLQPAMDRIVSGLARDGDDQRALEFLNTGAEPAFTLAEIGAAQCERGDTRLGRETLLSAIRAVEGASFVYDYLITKVALRAAAAGQRDLAYELARDADTTLNLPTQMDVEHNIWSAYRRPDAAVSSLLAVLRDVRNLVQLNELTRQRLIRAWAELIPENLPLFRQLVEVMEPRIVGGYLTMADDLLQVRDGEHIPVTFRRTAEVTRMFDMLDYRLSQPDAVTRPSPAPLQFQNRFGTAKARALTEYGGTPESEAAVAAGLKWLASIQQPDGSWDADTWGAGTVEFDENDVNREFAGRDADMGLTGLAVLAFLGAGHTPMHGDYAGNISRAVIWICTRQGVEGSLSGSAHRYAAAYCHPMALLALAEAFHFLPEDHALHDSLPAVLQAAVEHSKTLQLQDGGWRYLADQTEGDMSVASWEVAALLAARDAGVVIDSDTRSRMIRFLQDRSLGTNNGLAAYRAQDGVTAPMTAAAWYSKQLLGINRTNPASIEAAEYLLQNLPARSSLNYYYYYYGTLAMFRQGEQYWDAWNEALQPLLISEQITTGNLAGSWDPRDLWGAYGGRIYSTAMAVLCLETYYRYNVVENE